MPDAPDSLFIQFQAALVGGYSLERELGRGGMGVVYLAREVRLDRPVAIKLLPPGMARDGTLRERFLREARTAAKLSHPHIIPIFTVAEVGDFVFFAMAYVDGETLTSACGAAARCHHPKRRACCGRSPGRWRTPTRRGWCTATSRRTTSCWRPRRAALSSPTSGLPGWCATPPRWPAVR